MVSCRFLPLIRCSITAMLTSNTITNYSNTVTAQMTILHNIPNYLSACNEIPTGILSISLPKKHQRGRLFFSFCIHHRPLLCKYAIYAFLLIWYVKNVNFQKTRTKTYHMIDADVIPVFHYFIAFISRLIWQS
jgi:hypothetical protein